MNEIKNKQLILIAGGGTGGHIYPAVAIAQALKKNPDVVVEFVGTQYGLETKIIPREGFGLHTIPAGPLNNVSKLTMLISLIMLPWGIFKGIRLLLKLKPKIVLGVGGYASGPMMLAAILTGQSTALFEPNAYPGLTNRWLAKFVDMAFINFEISQKYFVNPKRYGMPVRKGLSFDSVATAHSETDKLKVLIFGGSQGARGINKTVVAAFKDARTNRSSWVDDYEFVHQIGATDWSHFDSEYKSLQIPSVKAFEFLYDMPERYKWADLIFCRAGAATLSEIAACRKAAVLIPFPFASDDHQRKNAEALSRQGAAMMILQRDFTPQKFVDTLRYFNNSRNKLDKYESVVQKFHINGAAEKIAEDLMNFEKV